jgi:hypothetical protein
LRKGEEDPEPQLTMDIRFHLRRQLPRVATISRLKQAWRCDCGGVQFSWGISPRLENERIPSFCASPVAGLCAIPACDMQNGSTAPKSATSPLGDVERLLGNY